MIHQTFCVITPRSAVHTTNMLPPRFQIAAFFAARVFASSVGDAESDRVAIVFLKISRYLRSPGSIGFPLIAETPGLDLIGR